jgi:predicted regulator of Ras-like GTPase activity (Roadblock/LC7/MglB family)
VTSPFTSVLDAFSKQKGVQASLAVSARDGIAIEANLQIGQDGTRVAALAASVYSRARKAALAAGLGATGFLQLEAEYGRLCMLGGEDVILVIVGDPQANVGLIRMELLRAAEALA